MATQIKIRHQLEIEMVRFLPFKAGRFSRAVVDPSTGMPEDFIFIPCRKVPSNRLRMAVSAASLAPRGSSDANRASKACSSYQMYHNGEWDHPSDRQNQQETPINREFSGTLIV